MIHKDNKIKQKNPAIQKMKCGKLTFYHSESSNCFKINKANATKKAGKK